MVHYHNFEQGSEEWLQFRYDKLTGSHATPIGANGAGLKTYAMEKAMLMCGGTKEHYVNSDMERGNEFEPLANTCYELQFGVKIYSTGCITNDKYLSVCVSPDGLIDFDGGIEIKARNDAKHYSLIMGETKEIPFNQIQMNLLVSERKWWDFASFNPNFSKPLFVKRIYPDLLYFKKLEHGFIDGNKMVKKFVEQYNEFNLQIK